MILCIKASKILLKSLKMYQDLFKKKKKKSQKKLQVNI